MNKAARSSTLNKIKILAALQNDKTRNNTEKTGFFERIVAKPIKINVNTNKKCNSCIQKINYLSF